ncbi:class F sortase [Patescibacteria group bacterium]|nr:class F sortase [Patescibacteria group bacterium]
MSEKLLLLYSARSGVLVEPPRASPRWRTAAALMGILMILVGAADATSRLAQSVFGSGAGVAAFAPVATIGNPSLLALLQAGQSPATTTALLPARIMVGAALVDAAVEPVGKKPDGSMDTPKNFTDVAWYSLGAKPGEAGNAVFAGHVNNALGTAGVFEHLTDISIGDQIVIADVQGRMLTYVVRAVDLYRVDTAPLETIFRMVGPSQVVLITCEGVWDKDTRSYTKRLVVTASLEM